MKDNIDPKDIFIERLRKLLKDDKDVESFFEVAKTRPRKSIRTNTLKISPEELKKRLEDYGWKLRQLEDHPEVMQVLSELKPGEIGKTKEHILGYYYVQEITSMMPIIALEPRPNDILLDLCAAPGSKTTQAAVAMENTGTIIANDVSIGRISILSANLERFGITNTIITRHEGLQLTKRLKELSFRFDKVLVDAPCSGEGNLRLSPKTFEEWSINLVKKMGAVQKQLASKALESLKINGEMVYSTCTHSPEENEEVVQFLLDNYDVEIMKIKLPIKSRTGILEWNDKKFDKSIINAHRIYHHDNDMEGFFLCKLKKLSDDKKEKK